MSCGYTLLQILYRDALPNFVLLFQDQLVSLRAWNCDDPKFKIAPASMPASYEHIGRIVPASPKKGGAELPQL